MEFRREYWVAASVGLLLAVLAALFVSRTLLVGAAGVGAWLLARQYAFVREAAAIREGITVAEGVDRQRTYPEEAVAVTLTPRLAEETSLRVEVESRPPITATGSSREDRVAGLGETRTYAAEFPVVGEFAFDDPLVTVTERGGLFAEEFTAGFGPMVTVEPRTPRNVHIGRGGTKVATVYGEHDAGRVGTGLDPAELREYRPGDAAHRIDWKATARLRDLHVREFEAETDHETVLVVDHRASTGTGADGVTALDYLRQVALTFAGTAARLNDPLAFYGVGDGGTTAARRSGTGTAQYRAIRKRLLALSPTTPDGERIDPYGPAAARRAAIRLRDDDTPFARTLRPFFGVSTGYVRRVERDPLVETVRDHLPHIRRSVRTVILTDDSNRIEVTEAVKLARGGGGHVLVFLAPTVLFEPGGMADLERAYDRYLDFEEFRRELARIDRVEALEIGPGDRIDAVLANRRRRETTST